MSKDEMAAADAWKEYHAAIEKYKLDDKGANHSNKYYHYDGFFAGFYAGRDYQRDKKNDKITSAVSKVLHAKGSSKKAKTARGSALTGGRR